MRREARREERIGGAKGFGDGGETIKDEAEEDDSKTDEDEGIDGGGGDERPFEVEEKEGNGKNGLVGHEGL